MANKHLLIEAAKKYVERYDLLLADTEVALPEYNQHYNRFHAALEAPEDGEECKVLDRLNKARAFELAFAIMTGSSGKPLKSSALLLFDQSLSESCTKCTCGKSHQTSSTSVHRKEPPLEDTQVDHKL